MTVDRAPLFTGWSPLRTPPRQHLPERVRHHLVPSVHRVPPSTSPTQLVGLEDGVVEQARLLAEQLLTTVDDGGRRWRHTCSVAARATEGAAAVAPEQVDLLLCAAWLHDIGYAPSLARTGFHPVDGATHLQRELWAPAVVGLVAHHSGSRFVAGARQVQHHLAPFDRTSYWSGPVADALTWADQTTDPDGGRVSVHERLAEVLQRHGRTSAQARCHAQRGPALIAAVRATETRLAVAGQQAQLAEEPSARAAG